MKSVIIDCDPGNGIPGANTDDGLALALALASPGLRLELITTVSGNTPSETGLAVAQDLVARSGRAVPVVRGASEALVEPAEPWRAQLDRRVHENGLAGLWQGVAVPPKGPAGEPRAAQAMGELICARPGEITLVAIGPLTNVALAMQLFPAMAGQVAEIVIMGGVFAVDHYLKDTNFGLDPEAAHKVLHSGARITLVPMDVTTQTLMTEADLDRIAGLHTPLADYIAHTMRPWIAYAMQTRQLPGCWIHDALAVAWLLDPSLVERAAFQVGIDLHAGPTRGRSWRVRHPLRLDVGIVLPPQPPITVLTQVDNVRLLALINSVLANT
ncbi:nucleoside hydrolase [Pantoea sp. 1.19]|uniref:nucleoside hydrolase n=1 Tax=Pantoea sp. 1.19 TaxID=1925589 RepID=UPI000948EBCF|nr:nucleoside hydrolase [Pantoea sp. 1.19]